MLMNIVLSQPNRNSGKTIEELTPRKKWRIERYEIEITTKLFPSFQNRQRNPRGAVEFRGQREVLSRDSSIDEERRITHATSTTGMLKNKKN